MYNSEKVRERILEIMADGRPYQMKQLKSIIRNETTETISEGIFANSIRTLTVNGQVQLLNRGCYQIATPALPHTSSSSPVSSSKSQIIDEVNRLTEEYKKNVLRLIDSINISQDDITLVEYALALRKKMNNL